MKDAEEWFPILNGLPNTDEAGVFASPEFIKVIKAIQRDALLEAAEIANSDAIKVYGSQEYNMGVMAVHDAILARAKEVE